MRSAALLAILLVAAPASADPYRLRGDVFASAEPPVGLLVLQADGQEQRWLDAEALVWTGAQDEEGTGDALVIAFRIRDPENRGEARVGRFVVSTGAVRPVHIDGVSLTGRAPWGTGVELFGGMPVIPAFGARDYDWLFGSRVSHRYDDLGTVGVSFLHRRDHGRLSDQEVGVDFGARPLRWLDVGARAAYDLIDPGLSDAHLSLAARRGAWRYELYGARRSPSRLLPATSLFSALGDLPSTAAGTVVTWRAAPRLDLIASGAARVVDEEIGEDLSLRTVLRLDDEGAGALALEMRREGAPAGSWSGARGTARIPIAETVSTAAELELVVPDDPRGRGAVWPWGLWAITWRATERWEAAAAVEARSTPESRWELGALLRLSRRWRVP